MSTEQFAMSRFASKADREVAINRAIDRLASKRDYAADKMGQVFLAATYQQDIDKLVALLDAPPITPAEGEKR